MAKKSTRPVHEEWLEIANQDLYAAAKLLQDDDRTLAPSIYHTQQCAEKALKAFLVLNNFPIERTHDLLKLLAVCCEFDKEFSQLLSATSDLNPFSTDSRYPDNSTMMPYRPQVEKAFEQAAIILNYVRDKIDLATK
jgi:HEPN domain-containing protein